MDNLERELLYRLANGMPEAGHTVEVHVGALPADFPLTLPPQTHLLGSLQRRTPDIPPGAVGMYHLGHTQVVLDTPLSSSAWLAELRAHLGPEWEAPPHPGFEQSGFLPATAPNLLNLESRTLGKGLYVQAVTVGSDTQVQLALNDISPMHFLHREQGGFFPQPPRLQLHAPEGVVVIPSNGGGSSTHMAYSALLRSDWTVSALMTHFANQLRTQGWQELVQHATSALAVSIWQKDEGKFVYLTLEAQVGAVMASLIVQAPEPSMPSFSVARM